jgi:predicted cobalt transporter CbtA
VASAIGIEESATTGGHEHDDAAAEHSHGEEAEVSRQHQATWGLATATVVGGVALGGIVGLAAAFACGRLGRLSPRASTALVAGIGFVAVFLVPYLKYPPNPPAVGNPDTIGQRTAWYFGMLAVSAITAILAVVAAPRLAPRYGSWNGGLIAAAGYLTVVLMAAWLLPAVDEVPAGFPADLLWQFRIASLGVQATLWAVIGLALATMIGSVARRAADRGGQLAGNAA